MQIEHAVYGILPHPNITGQVLVLKEEEGWSLPGMRVGEPISTILATREMSQMLGQPVVAYRYVFIKENKQLGRQEGIFLIDNLGSDEIKQVGRWVSREDLPNLQF